jgi:rod shape-determining protein MreC
MALSTPDSDQRGFRDTSPGLRLALICILCISLMVLDKQNQHLRDIRRLLDAAAYPIRVAVDAPFAAANWLAESFSTRSRLSRQNEAFKERILVQSARLQRLAALEAENARLRALLDSTAKVGDRVLIAEILSVDMDPFRHRIVVNKGGADGVYVGQALIDAEGIVGQVTRDQVFSAEAILITDIDHALPVELARNRLRTIVVGTGDLARLSLPYVPRNGDVREGDLLVTSGLGGTFPAGYPVGSISAVEGDSGQPFLNVSAEPAAALNRIREVLLIWPGATQADQLQAEPREPESLELGARPSAGPVSAEPAAGAETESPAPAATPAVTPDPAENGGEPGEASE